MAAGSSAKEPGRKSQAVWGLEFSLRANRSHWSLEIRQRAPQRPAPEKDISSDRMKTGLEIGGIKNQQPSGVSCGLVTAPFADFKLRSHHSHHQSFQALPSHPFVSL